MFIDRVDRRWGAAFPILAVAAVTLIAVGAVVALRPSLVQVRGRPSCGGNAKIVPAPSTCTRTTVIVGTAFTVVIDATAGGVATVTYTLDAPRPADTSIRVRWHIGISSHPSVARSPGSSRPDRRARSS